MSRQKTKDRAKILAVLNDAVSKLSVSVSYDGGLMYDGRITCGISSTDTTQHRLFVFVVDIEEEYPLDPSILTIADVAELARSVMREKYIDLHVEKCNTFVVSSVQQNVAKEGAANAKYRAVVTVPTVEVFVPGTKSNPCADTRMPHILFSKKIETKAPMVNRDGGSATVNTERIQEAIVKLKRTLHTTFVTKSRPLPPYTSEFT